MTNLRLLCVVALASLFLTSTIPATEVKEVAYPDGYRNWVHVKTAVIGPDSAGFARFGGMHHIYANEKAMEGYRTGHFPDGSILVFDRLEAPVSQGVTTEGARQAVDVMLKDSAAFGPTGGWGYAEFRGDSRTERNASSDCASCHAKKSDHDSVFSVWKE